MGGQPKPACYAALALVVLGLIGFAVYRNDIFAPKAPNKTNGTIDPKLLTKEAENPQGGSITSLKEYSFKPADRLPEVKGISEYKKLENNTVRFAINVWAGW